MNKSMNKPMNKPIYSFEPNYSWPCDYCKEKFIDKFDILLMGDSFAEGSCVNQSDEPTNLLNQNYNLLNDFRFAETYARIRMRKGFGPNKIHYELTNKGIKESISNEIITAEDLDNSRERSKIGIATSFSFCNRNKKFKKPITSNVSGAPFFKIEDIVTMLNMSWRLEITLCSQRCDYSQKVRTLPAVYYIKRVIMALKLFPFHS